MKNHSKKDSEKKKEPEKNKESGLSISNALRATKRKLFSQKTNLTKVAAENTSSSIDTSKENKPLKTAHELTQLSNKGNSLYQSIKSPPEHLKKQFISDEEARNLLVQYESRKKANMSREEMIDLYRSLQPKPPTVKDQRIEQKKQPLQVDTAIIEEKPKSKVPKKSSYMINGMIYRHDQKVEETKSISTIDTGDGIDVRDVESPMQKTSPLQERNAESSVQSDKIVRTKPARLYQSRMVNGRIYRYDQEVPVSEQRQQELKSNALVARDVQSHWKKARANRTIEIDLPHSQGKTTVKLIASKKLGGGAFGTAKKILVEHLDGRQEKMVVKVIKHGNNIDFKLIEREGEILETVGMLKGVRATSWQHNFFMPYVGKKISRYLINQDPGNMQFSLSADERYVAIMGLLESLVKIHGRKVIHSDIGIHNLGLRKHPLSAALFDFNLSVREGEKRGNAGVPFTAAPEILKGEGNSYASDVYSAAITIALLLEITTYKMLQFIELPQHVAPVAFLAPKDDGPLKEGAISKMQRTFGFTAQQAECIYSLLEKMTSKAPELRPTVEEAFSSFHELLKTPKASTEYRALS
ncbi:protein kinase domain-containing protein [Legionella sp. WA2022007384]